MPELPEVEVVRRGLAGHMLGARLTSVEVLDPRALKRHALGPDHFRDALLGRTVTEVARRGKFLWMNFADGGDALVVHLGMSGQLRVYGPERGEESDSSGVFGAAVPSAPGAGARAAHEGPASDPLRHLRLRMRLADGTRLHFLDQRLFGGMHLAPLVDTPDALPAGMGSVAPLLPATASHIARDLLDPHLDRAAVSARIRRRHAPIKNLILAQDVVSGIGNIYADEALWAARVHYQSPGSDLSARRVSTLLDAASSVMQRALAVGGTSFDALYVNVDGRSGYFARSLSAYGQEGEPCERCGRPIKRAKFMNRSSYFCPRCQKRA
ncbi:MAG: bifunctional DNA-formamidopyrimidine glycosylase/DNA-(apurinic or apyrimidinic site) lyase [Dermabacter sp.]|nr:bifunctional DNA-formamidopyrimidine glycosylase/DNA-(apurinic or apyrimidinic site) lyase [Dermabacter sp.]